MEIISLLNSGIKKPKLLIQALKTKGFQEPNYKMLANFLAVHRKTIVAPIVSLGELEAYCNNKNYVSGAEDEPFLVDSFFL